MTDAPKVRGGRPRPRVALVGKWTVEEKTYFNRVFPTCWYGRNDGEILKQVKGTELDLVIYAADVPFNRMFFVSQHVIVFYELGAFSGMPGPCPGTYMTLGKTDSAEYFLPKLPAPFTKPRNAFLRTYETMRG